MFEIGRMCIKIAGRDAGKKCIIIDVIDSNTVMIDGETRRRECNPKHLELLNKVIKIKKNASHQEVADALKKEGIESRSTKPKKAAAKPHKQKKSQKAAVSEEKESKKEPKKETKKKK